jgi:transposase
MLTALTNWETEIFVYFDAPKEITNGYTEAMNGIAKLTNHTWRGYSFAALRAKVLYNGNLHVTRPVFRHSMTIADLGVPYSLQESWDQSPTEKTESNFGALLSILVQEIEQGEF